MTFKTLEWRKPRPVWSPFYGRRKTLAPLTSAARDQLSEPWPDLVLAIGWRSVPVAHWIAAQAGAVHIRLGRPRAPLSDFDLVLTTRQYGLPPSDNVRRLSGPIGGPDRQALSAAHLEWHDKLAHLPHPRVAVLVGGSAPPLVLDAQAAAKLGRQAVALANKKGGSLLITTGPRTEAKAIAAIRDAVDAPFHFHAWGKDKDNPYLGYLALADEIIVTGDSVSMMEDARRTGRPIHVFPLPHALGRVGHLWSHVQAGLDRMAVVQTLRRAGILRSPRRASAYSDLLIASGQAVLLGQGTPRTLTPDGLADPLDEAVAAIHALMNTRR